eukprot:5514944-Heterocapsa_arctica.AAC.1
MASYAIDSQRDGRACGARQLLDEPRAMRPARPSPCDSAPAHWMFFYRSVSYRNGQCLVWRVSEGQWNPLRTSRLEG